MTSPNNTPNTASFDLLAGIAAQPVGSIEKAVPVSADELNFSSLAERITGFKQRTSPFVGVDDVSRLIAREVTAGRIHPDEGEDYMYEIETAERLPLLVIDRNTLAGVVNAVRALSEAILDRAVMMGTGNDDAANDEIFEGICHEMRVLVDQVDWLETAHEDADDYALIEDFVGCLGND
jgi:hypothetical protein